MDIFVSLPAQKLELYDGAMLLESYQISSSERGAGEASGSFMTPRGRHLIRAKIGTGCPENSVFIARRPTGEIWTPELSAAFPGRDWVLTRILWLSGCEPGCNRLGEVDTMRRYIYVHGAPDSAPMGEPASHGCLRMRNADIIALFERIPVYIPVNIGDFRVSTELSREQSFVTRALSASGQSVGQCFADQSGLITSFEVTESWQGKGVATQLLRSTIALARTSGVGQLKVDLPCQLESFLRLMKFQIVKSASSSNSLALNIGSESTVAS